MSLIENSCMRIFPADFSKTPNEIGTLPRLSGDEEITGPRGVPSLPRIFGEEKEKGAPSLCYGAKDSPI